jgi:hypothetical protein
MLLALLATLTLPACAANTTETAPRVISNYCLVSGAITYSEAHGADTEDASNKYDTPETIEQVKNHDLVWERLCGGGSQSPPEA